MDRCGATTIEPPSTDVVYETSLQLSRIFSNINFGVKTEDQARIMLNAKSFVRSDNRKLVSELLQK